MATFIKCSCENAKYHGYTMKNSPVNIELVTQVSKITEAYYPDNEGTPAIMFSGIDIKWVYEKTQETQRNADYQNIINNNFPKP